MNPFPTISVVEVFHVGHLDASLKGKNHNRCSLEGTGLSVSVHPETWKKIAKLGEGSTWSMTPAAGKAKLLNVLALKREQWEEILTWGLANGWLTPSAAYRVSWETDELDEEGPGQHYMLFESFSEALEAAEERDTKPESIVSQRASQKMTDRLGFTPDLALVPDMMMTLYTEDVLWGREGIHGAWWNENLCVEQLSAPRGVIHQQALNHWIATEVADREEFRPRGPN